MEILVISHKYPPSIGGMQMHCFKLVQELEKEHQIHPLIFKSNYPKIFFFATVVFRAWRMLQKHPSINVIYANDGLMALVITPLLFLTKIPIAVTIHGLDVNFPSSFYQRWVKKYLNRFDAIITVSEPTTRLCIEKGLNPNKVVMAENAVDVTPPKVVQSTNIKQELSALLNINLDGKVIICSLGRAIPRKGFSWFAKKVMSDLPDHVIYLVLARKFKQANLFKWISRLTTKSFFEKIRLLIGAEVDELVLNETIKKQNLSERVFHVHQYTQSRDKLFEVISASDFFVMPNLKIKGDYEGFGLVALEAASLGTLTLAADVDGIPSAVKDGVNGFLIPSGEEEAWIKKIKHFLKHPEEHQKSVQTFQKAATSKNRSWSAMAANYVDIFAKL